MELIFRGASTMAGYTISPNFPTTPNAYSRSLLGGRAIPDAFATRLDMLPTGVSAYGNSSPGCNGALTISVSSWPQLGNSSFSVTTSGAPANSNSGFLLLSVAPMSPPLNVLGVDLWVSLSPSSLALRATSSSAGAADVPLPLPNTPSLVGQSLYAQFVWIGPTTPPPCPPLGLSASNALEITIQP